LDENAKRIILKNFWEFYELANSAFEQKKFNGAVTLYYKALVELCDLFLVSKSGQIGINHSERFRMLEKFNPELYEISDKLFRFYRDSYNKEISLAIAKVVKEHVEKAKNLVIPSAKN
jgi:phosphosulfolactate synthase (CoM biosynthesis protein A)